MNTLTPSGREILSDNSRRMLGVQANGETSEWEWKANILPKELPHLAANI
jgi:hypothetical protein